MSVLPGQGGSVLARPRGLCHLADMSTEWISTAIAGTVGVLGIGGTLLSGRQARKHAEALAIRGEQEARRATARLERIAVYTDVLAHAVHQERRLNAVPYRHGDQVVDLAPQPVGGRAALVPMDAVTVRVALLASADVQRAWSAFVDAWSRFAWWANTEATPDDEPPDGMVKDLRAVISELHVTCRASLSEEGVI